MDPPCLKCLGRVAVGSRPVLLLGGDFGNSKVVLRPAGCSKKSQKSRDVSVRLVEFLEIFGGLQLICQLICTRFLTNNIGKNRHLKTTLKPD